MMSHLHAEAVDWGATVVRLRVHQDNITARRLYESLGYAYAGEERGELIGIPHDVPPKTARASPQSLHGRLLDCDAPEWEKMLGVVPHDFHHLPAYVKLSATEEGARACALYVSDGLRDLLLPLLIRRIPGGGFDAMSPYGYPGPIGTGVEDPEFLKDALVAGLQVLREAGLVSVFVRLHPLLNPAPPGGIGTLVSHGDTVSIDLTISAEEQWARTRRNHRQDITRAMRLGYIVRMDDQWAHLDDFRRLYRQTMERRHASTFYRFEDSYFDRLRDALGERIHLCLVERDDRVVAAGLFVETGGIVQAHLAGTDEGSGNIRPTKLMFHFVGGWAKARGDRALFLGGGLGGANDSLLHFKAGFSPLRHPFATLRTVIDEREYRRLVGERDPYLDPNDRSGFFPMYRLP